MLIGISGKMGAGKDSFAIEIMKLCPEFINKKFADKVKQVAAILSGLPLEDMYSQEGKVKYLPYLEMTVRELQQRVGTEAGRQAIHPDVWVSALLGTYDPSIHNWIVSDVRFPNEANDIRKLGGYLVRINGSRIRDIKNSDTYRNIVTHPSETSLDNYPHWDFSFNNFNDDNKYTLKVMAADFVENMLGIDLNDRKRQATSSNTR